MVTTNTNQVLQVMQSKQISYFRIFDATGKNLCYQQDDEETTPAEAYNELSDVLKNLESGIVTIVLSEKSFKEKGAGNPKGGNYNFRVRVGNNLTTSINGVINEDIRSLMNENAELKLKLMLQEQEHKNAENQRKLEEKIEGLKNEDPLEKYAPFLQPILMKIFSSGEIPTTAAINGTPVDNQTATDKKTIITQAVNRLLKIDPDFAVNITLLADFGEKNPEKYKSFIPMLKIM
jgi:hypothetical protein